MTKYILILSAFLIFVQPAFAGRPGGGVGAGDGGQSVVCGSLESIISAELLDLYEWRRLYNVNPNYGPASVAQDHPSMSNFVRLAESRFNESMDETPEIQALFKKVIFYVNGDLGHLQYADTLDSTDDTGPVEATIKRGCSLRQAAVFDSKNDTINPYIVVNENIWMEMDSVDNISLLIHEIFHSYFPEDPVYGTLALRQFVGFLSSPKEFRETNTALFVRLVQTRQPQDPASFKSSAN